MDFNSTFKYTEMVIKYNVKINFSISTHYDNIILDRGGSGMSGNYSYGYARVSTQQQDLSRQLDMLKQLHCNEILTEKI